MVESKDRPVVAALISLIVPGAGHVYRGRLRRGAAWFAALTVVFLTFPWTGPLGLVAAYGARFVAVPVDAALCARGEPLPNRTQLGAALIMLVVMVSTALTVRLYVVEAFKVPAASMCPTLQVGDFMFIDKLDHGGLGDVVVFRHPLQPRDFVKRVVAGAGDRVAVRDGVLYRNDVAVPRGPTTPCTYDDRREYEGAWESVDRLCAEEALGGHRFTVMLEPDGSAVHDFPQLDGDRPPRFDVMYSRRPAPPLDVVDGAYVVPPGHVFVMGDNRDNSNDSRSWGPVPVGNIKGVAMYVWWSRGPDGVRWGRLGHTIR